MSLRLELLPTFTPSMGPCLDELPHAANKTTKPHKAYFLRREKKTEII
jgi:hypothetical protein